MKKLLTAGLLLTGLTLQAQRLSLGFTLSTPAYHRLELPDQFIFPQHSYFIYYVGNPKKDHKPVRERTLNGFSYGLNLGVDYKRFMFTLEVQNAFTTIKLPAHYRSPLGELLEDSWSTFNVKSSAMVVPMIVSCRLNRKANGPFILGGLQYTFFNTYNEPNDGLNSEISGGINLFIADTEMYDVLYNEFSYWSYVAGIGYKRNDSYWSIRCHQRLNNKPEEMPLARYFQADLVYTRTLNFQKLRKGHIIYTD